ncbi:TPA_asm: coat protein [ssRNA phage Gephyllon.3_5]|uniref:Coat protein n=2 Tax=Fiersviridae TaxID=2842319 RepID=A0A8S5L2A7_9VIRU|nr:coat protein [ssRNA phage Gephyllon.3_5]QDH90722.1 MAG: hypothetical protein H3BulkLitter171063_000003 [Leviviridae sp.]DAD51543.1 TPA_asm: coat protein [ssRNA phage Gephyllon.3_5]
MPIQASMTLNTKVYTPRGTSNGVSKWALTGDATFGGAQSEVTESVKGPYSDGTYRTRWVLLVPKAATADTACGCVGTITGTGKADFNITFPVNFTQAEKQDFVDRIQSMVATTVFDVSVATPEGSW